MQNDLSLNWISKTSFLETEIYNANISNVSFQWKGRNTFRTVPPQSMNKPMTPMQRVKHDLQKNKWSSDW